MKTNNKGQIGESIKGKQLTGKGHHTPHYLKTSRDQVADIPAVTIDYPKGKEEVTTFNQKFLQRQNLGVPGGYGMLTQGDVDRILAARKKRERKRFKGHV